MPPSPARPDVAALDAFVALVGERAWRDRMVEIGRQAQRGPRQGRAILQRHASEITIERLRQRFNREPTSAERHIAALAAASVRLAGSLSPSGRERLLDRLGLSVRDQATLIPLLHLLRTALLQRERGFDVRFTGLEDGTPYDLIVARDGTEAEIVCDTVSAEEGRSVHRGAWFRLADRIDPDLQTWLAAHPGRYLLKMTLPNGLRGPLDGPADEPADLAALHARINAMLADRQRATSDAAIVLRLDPLLLAAAQSDDQHLMPVLRREFGPEAHLAVMSEGDATFVLAARAGQQNEIATAILRRMRRTAPERLSGARPGILAMFVDDVERPEWDGLRDRLELEGEARQFLTLPEARGVVAVSYVSRTELFGIAVSETETADLRFRNPSHPAAKSPALAAAILSSM